MDEGKEDEQEVDGWLGSYVIMSSAYNSRKSEEWGELTILKEHPYLSHLSQRGFVTFNRPPTSPTIACNCQT